MNYNQLSQAIQDYLETTEPLFVASIPTFVQQAEDRIYNSVLIPALRKNVIGTVTAANKYLACPDDFLSAFSIAIVQTDGSYEYMLNKDVSFIRSAYPNPSDVGVPRYYALFGSQYTNRNELSFILGPMPDSNYQCELHYFYYPPTIVQGVIATTTDLVGGSSYTDGTYYGVSLINGPDDSGAIVTIPPGAIISTQASGATADIVVSGGTVTSVTIRNGGSLYAAGDMISCYAADIGGTGDNMFYCKVATVSNSSGTSWLGDNYAPVLLYGAMREAVIFQKGEQDMVQYYEQKYQEAVQQLIRLGDGLERGDSYRDGQAKVRVTT